MTYRARGQAVEILLVADNPGDVRLMMETLHEGTMHCHVSVMRDGVDALAFLHRAGKHADAPCPDLVLIDLNRPKRDGRDVLAEIKRDPDLKRIPVVALTGSQPEADIMRAYELQADCCISKPANPDQIVSTVRCIEHYWLMVVNLPPSGLSHGISRETPVGADRAK